MTSHTQVAAQVVVAPCSDADGRIPDGCPGWCEYAAPDHHMQRPCHADEPATLGSGSPVPGGLRLEEALGRGGMGLVFAAREVATGRRVAVKFLSDRYLHHSAARGRFVSEARALARIDSPRVCAVLDYGVHDRRPYITMEYVEGIQLRRVMEEDDRPMPIRRALIVLREVALGLAAIHDTGTLHNDIKPANVMLGPVGQVTLVDLGLARPFASVCVIPEHEVIGTPLYMAPELMSAEARRPHLTTDLYALGVLAYELLTGTMPFDLPDTEAILMRKLCVPLVPASTVRAGLPYEIDDLLSAATHRDPAYRPLSARQFAAVFDAAL